MSRIAINKSSLKIFRKSDAYKSKRKTTSNRKVLYIKKHPNHQVKKISKKGNIKISFANAGFILAIVIVFSGALYLYQVNSLISKGYEVRSLENQIKNLQEINQKNKIKKVELQSMYNIEKNTQNLNLISSNDVSYLEINGHVAMK